ncbi:MAG: hypothetical protein ACN6RK_14650 [Stenotrophomonas sp.]
MSTPATPARPVLVYRQVSFTLAAFDHLKNWQRHLESTEGRRVTNSEALERLILSHPKP